MTGDAMIAIGGAAGGLGLLGLAYVAGCLASERRRDKALAAARPLETGRLVQVDTDPHRGMCGWVREFRMDNRTGKTAVKIELNDGQIIVVPRNDVSLVFG